MRQTPRRLDGDLHAPFEGGLRDAGHVLGVGDVVEAEVSGDLDEARNRARARDAHARGVLDDALQKLPRGPVIRHCRVRQAIVALPLATIREVGPERDAGHGDQIEPDPRLIVVGVAAADPDAVAHVAVVPLLVAVSEVGDQGVGGEETLVGDERDAVGGQGEAEAVGFGAVRATVVFDEVVQHPLAAKIAEGRAVGEVDGEEVVAGRFLEDLGENVGCERVDIVEAEIFCLSTINDSLAHRAFESAETDI